MTHAHIFFKAEATNAQPCWTDQAIGTALDISVVTTERVRGSNVQQGLTAALKRNADPDIVPDDSMETRKPI